MEADEKICPRCAETVKAAALVCKHCGYEFASAQANVVPPPPAAPMAPPSPSVAPSPMPRSMTQPPPPAANPAPKGRTFLVVAAIIVGVVVLLVILGALAGTGDSPQSAGNQPVAATPEDGSTGDGNAPAAAGDSAGSSGDAQASDATAVTSVDLAKAYSANEVAAQKTYGDRTLDVTGTITGVTLDIFNNPVIQMEGVNEFLPVQAAFDKTYSDKISALNKGDQVTVRCTSITEVISAPQLSDCVLAE